MMEGKECGPHKGRGRGLNPGLRVLRSKGVLPKAESAFLQLSTEILEGCSLRWFAPSEFSPWPAQENCDSNSEGSQPGGGEGLRPE